MILERGRLCERNTAAIFGGPSSPGGRLRLLYHCADVGSNIGNPLFLLSFLPSFLPSRRRGLRRRPSTGTPGGRRGTRSSVTTTHRHARGIATRLNDFLSFCRVGKMFGPIYDFHTYPSSSPPQTNHTTVTELGNSRRSSALT